MSQFHALVGCEITPTGDEDPAAAEANAAVPEQATALADGTMAEHDKQSVGGVKVGAYTAYEPFVLIVAPDFSQRLAWTASGWRGRRSR